MLPLPVIAYDASDKHATRVSSLSLVRYRTNDYSVPVAYGHRDVLVRGYVHQVVISCGPEVIARHLRSYARDDFVFDPLHYLPLLEQKTGALDQAAPLVGWELPKEFAVLRRLLESRMGQRGKREFVQVLRLMENFRKQEVHSAVGDALSRDSPDQTTFPGYSSFWDTAIYNPAFQGRQMRPDSLKFPAFIGQTLYCQA